VFGNKMLMKILGPKKDEVRWVIWENYITIYRPAGHLVLLG
jgi:hypothetical protein